MDRPEAAGPSMWAGQTRGTTLGAPSGPHGPPLLKRRAQTARGASAASGTERPPRLAPVFCLPAPPKGGPGHSPLRPGLTRHALRSYPDRAARGRHPGPRTAVSAPPSQTKPDLSDFLICPMKRTAGT